MCGITGFYQVSKKNQVIELQTLEAMSLAMQHRGPDNQGAFYNHFVGLAHNRLSIIDLSTSANQPFSLADNSVVMVYNGEVYNFQEIRTELEKEGVTFQTSSDTEVVFQAYLAWGENSFSRLNGMFAFAIWDQRKETLWVVRDRFGIKPLYFSYLPDQTFLFGSEIKSILRSNLVGKEVRSQGLQEYLWFGNALGTNTMYEKIEKIRPGHYLRINSSGLQSMPYWDASSLHDFEKEPSTEEAKSKIQGLLNQSIRRQLISDVPVGVFLSGGIDSSAITAIASKFYSKKLDTFSVEFDVNFFGKSELDKARLVAERFQTNHHEIKVGAFGLEDTIETLVQCHDEPFADAANIPLYLLSKQIKGQIKVVLQGDGGDEIFAGYRRYNLLSWYKWWKALSHVNPLYKKIPIQHPWKQRLGRMLDLFEEKEESHILAYLLTVESKQSSPERVLSAAWQSNLSHCNPFLEYEKQNKRFQHKDIVQRMLFMDTQILLPNAFLEKVDKPTMANSLEVRVPFLDYDLTDYVMRLPSSMKVKENQKKWILRESLRGTVPNEILDAPKRGFGVPYGEWVGTTLASYFQDILSEQKVRESGWFSKTFVDECMKQHQSKERNHGFLLWKVLQLALWCKHYQ